MKQNITNELEKKEKKLRFKKEYLKNILCNQNYFRNISKKQQELNKFLKEYLKTERIQSSKFPCIVFFFFIKKKYSFLKLV